MSGIKGISRLPRDTVRARRNATQLASNFTAIIGDGLEITGVGLLAIDLAANPGLAFSGGDLICKVAAPIALDATGVHLDFGAGLQNLAGVLTTDDAAIDHNALTNYAGNEHIDHTGVTLTAGVGIAGGGTIAANRTFDLDILGLTTDTIAAGDWVPFHDLADTPNKIAFSDFEGSLNHDALTNYAGNEHYVQTAITNVSSVLATGLVKVTTGTGALSVVADSTADWDAAFTHVTNDGTDHGFIDQDVQAAASPTFAGLTLGALAGVLKSAAGVISGGANLNDLGDVNAGAPANNDCLTWDTVTSKWIPEAVAGAGETNTASSSGTGVSLYYQKAGVDLEFNAIKSENNRLTVSLDGVSHDVELTIVEGNIDHNALTNYAGNEHIDHTGVTLTTGDGLTGGGTIAANRTFAVDLSATPGLEISGAKLQAKVNTARQINRAAAGLELRGTYANTTENYNAAQSAATIQTAIDLLPKYIAEDVTLTIQFADGTYTLSHVLSFRGFWGPGILALEGNAGESGLHMNQAVDLDFSGQDCHGIDLIGITCQYVSVTNLDVKIKTNVAHYAAIRIVGSVSTVYTDGCYLHGTSNTKGWGMHASANSYIRPYATYVGTIYAGLWCDFSKGFSRDVDDDAANPPQYGLVAYNNSTIGKRSTQPAGSVANELTGYGSVIR